MLSENQIMLFRATKMVNMFTAGSVMALVTACAAIPDTSKPLPMLKQAELQSNESVDKSDGIPGQWPGDKWWITYGDSQLNALEEEALRGSPTLAAARARLQQAIAGSAEARSSLYPSVNATGSLKPTRQSYHNGVPIDAVPVGWNNSASLMLNLSYEIDLFGKNQALARAAGNERAAALAEMYQSKLTLSVAIANTWATLLGQNRELTLAQDTVRLRHNSLELVSRLYRQGMETADKVSQSRSELATARARLEAKKEQLLITRHQIAALLGAGPDRGLSIHLPSEAKIPVRGLPGNLSSDLLAHRPDIISARYQAEAAAERIKVAHANFYPSINLTAMIGKQVLGLDYFDHSDSRTGSWGPSFTLPIFEGGALRARYRESTAAYDEAVSVYNETLIEALRDVADTLTRLSRIQAQLDYSREAAQEAEHSWSLASQRYKAGLATYLDVLTAENTLISSREQVNDYEKQAFQRDIAVNRALGGGFSSASIND